MTMVTGTPTPLLLDGVKVTLNAPDTLGVPLMTPKTGLSDRPLGRPVATKVGAG